MAAPPSDLEKELFVLNDQVLSLIAPSYGEIRLEFGQLTESDHPALKGEYDGEWSLRTQGTRFVYSFDPEGIRNSSSGDSEEDHKLIPAMKRLEGQIVLLVLARRGLDIVFDSCDSFGLCPNEEDLKSDVPLWEFFDHKNHQSIVAYPNGTWKKRRSDIAEGEQ